MTGQIFTEPWNDVPNQYYVVLKLPKNEYARFVLLDKELPEPFNKSPDGSDVLWSYWVQHCHHRGDKEMYITVGRKVTSKIKGASTKWYNDINQLRGLPIELRAKYG